MFAYYRSPPGEVIVERDDDKITLTMPVYVAADLAENLTEPAKHDDGTNEMRGWLLDACGAGEDD